MMQLEQVISAYGATRGSLTKADGSAEESSGPGGGLVAAVEQRGLDAIAAGLSEGETLCLEDSGVSLVLKRSGNQARMRVTWTDGPTYEESIEVRPDSSTQNAPAPAPTVTTAATNHSPLFAPDPSTEVTDLVSALHRNDTPLYVSLSLIHI